MNYYERHIGDYLKDTAHLSLLEHGIYTRLLDVYYTKEVGIEEGMVARLIGARSDEELAALRVVLMEFFVLEAGVYVQARCDREIERYQDKQRKAKASAEASWKNRRAMPTQSERIADAEQTQCEGNAPNLQTPDTIPKERERQRSPRGARLPADWEPMAEGREFAQSVGIVGAAFNTEAAKFCDYWRAQPGAKGVKLDWPATWRNWCRNAKPAAVSKFGRPEVAPEEAERRAQLEHERSRELLRKQREHAEEVERQRLARLAAKAREAA